MGHEIERKFLVEGDFKARATSSIRLRQGYLSNDPRRTVRVRLAGDRGVLTIKGASTNNGLSRQEWEWPIAPSEAEELLELCLPDIIEKVRYHVPFAGKLFEVDVFEGQNRGLVLAEIELQHTDEPFDKPKWLGREVTGDKRFYSSALAIHPFCSWTGNTR